MSNYESRHPDDMVLHQLSEIREWDEANAVLGIQDSTQTAPEAIRELFAEIERLRAEKLELANHIDGCVRVAADALKRTGSAESWIAELVNVLTDARNAIASLPMETLGQQIHWPIRDELLHRIDKAMHHGLESGND